MKHILATILLITLNSKFCESQSYKEILVGSKADFNWRGYAGSNGIIYYSGKAWGITTRIEVDSVEFSKTDSVFTIVGQVVGNYEGSDRTGFCCFEIFLADKKGDSLLNISIVGNTNDKSNDNSNLPDGYFKIEIKPSKNQALFIATGSGKGLHEFSLEKIIVKSKEESVSEDNAKKITGTYKSTCITHNESDVVLIVKKDSTFEYKLALLDEKIFGNWVIIKDTLFLYSEVFNLPKIQMTPKRKFTDLPGYDAYIIKHQKLLGILVGKLPPGSCPLIKESN